jgi:hypothetical protein
MKMKSTSHNLASSCPERGVFFCPSTVNLKYPQLALGMPSSPEIGSEGTPASQLYRISA